jgi:hypothetical protein
LSGLPVARVIELGIALTDALTVAAATSLPRGSSLRGS